MTAAIPSFIAPVAPQAAVPPVAPAPQKGFAQMLSQRQAMAHEACAPAPAKPPTKPEHETAAPQPAAQRPAAKAPAGERPATTKADKTKTTGTAEAAPAEDRAAADKTETEPVDPALADWLAALNLPAAPTPTELPATAAAQGTSPEGELQAKAGAEGQAAQGGRAGLQIDPRAAAGGGRESVQEPAERLHAVRDTRDKPDAVAADAKTDAGAWQAAMERVNTPAEAQTRHETPSVAALAAATHTAGAHRTEPAAAPVAVSMPTPATAPEFAQSLGVQVSVLARDGIQQAELHLNPAEMGPISVQIALDGTQAQVNFGADSAATRQIIEGGLPELAAALRDAGFTLSGGGVHSQARGRGEGGESNGGNGFAPNGSPSGETDVTPRRINARVSAGGVDLYA